MKLVLFIMISCIYTLSHSQTTFTGRVTDLDNTPLLGAHIHTEQGSTLTDYEGKFSLFIKDSKSFRVTITYMGYQTLDTLIITDAHRQYHFRLQPEQAELDEVVIKRNTRRTPHQELVNNTFIKQNYAGSLAKSLEQLPGISSIDIGAGASKPMIRGMGFNRLVVAENNSKHEGQQWGADHGLEIDAFSAEEIEILKSSGMIEYGSDAMGGVIHIKNDVIPAPNSWNASYTLVGKSVNKGLLNHLQVSHRKNHFFYKLKATTNDYGDYSLPTDTIVYLSVKMPVYNQRLKNTAGRERNLLAQVGYVSDRFQSIWTVSNTYLKSGFFPGSHGLPSIDRVADDGNTRNIEFPYQTANHLKLTSGNHWFINESTLRFTWSLQHNLRREFSEFHTHYGDLAPPSKQPDLELEFALTTLESHLKYSHRFNNNSLLNIGIQHHYQNNTIQGYGFLLPEYNKHAWGTYLSWENRFSSKWDVHAGIRADQAFIHTQRYFDPLLYEYLIGKGNTPETAHAYALRSPDLETNYSNFNFLVGANYHPHPQWQLAATLGTSFRLPTAIELASNGIHHGSFRHEKGNPHLEPEKGWVLDVSAQFKNQQFQWTVSPYLYYFTNYIFLKPSGQFSQLPHGGQIYDYEQSQALITGIEMGFQATFFEKWNARLNAEYIYNQQITKNSSSDYPLPYSPPARVFTEIKYGLNNQSKGFSNTEFSLHNTTVFQQNRIAQNELPTAGYSIMGMGVSSNITLAKLTLHTQLQVTNLLNTRYYNHNSFYRALHIPEPGTNVQLMITIPFQS